MSISRISPAPDFGKTLGLIGRVVAYAVTFAAVCALLVVTLPAFAGYHNLVVTGGSMGRALPTGSVAVTRTTAVQDLQVGDVVAFRGSAGSATVVHRIVDISFGDGGERVATTRGDANRDNDPEPLNLAGHGDLVVYEIPWAGYAIVYAQSPVVLALLAAVVVASWILSRVNRKRRTEAHAIRLARA